MNRNCLFDKHKKTVKELQICKATIKELCVETINGSTGSQGPTGPAGNGGPTGPAGSSDQIINFVWASGNAALPPTTSEGFTPGVFLGAPVQLTTFTPSFFNIRQWILGDGSSVIYNPDEGSNLFSLQTTEDAFAIVVPTNGNVVAFAVNFSAEILSQLSSDANLSAIFHLDRSVPANNVGVQYMDALYTSQVSRTVGFSFSSSTVVGTYSVTNSQDFTDLPIIVNNGDRLAMRVNLIDISVSGGDLSKIGITVSALVILDIPSAV